MISRSSRWSFHHPLVRRNLLCLPDLPGLTERKQTEGRLREQAKLLDLAQDAIMVREMETGLNFGITARRNCMAGPPPKCTASKLPAFFTKKPPPPFSRQR